MHIAQTWRLKNQRYEMKGVKCENCQKAIFPPREVCPYCASNRTVAYVLELPHTLTATATSLERAAR